MINALVILTLLLLLSIWVQFYFLLQTVKNLTMPTVETSVFAPEPFITSTHPSLVSEDAAGQADDSVIVNPKTPQRVEWEEQEELRKMQFGPK